MDRPKLHLLLSYEDDDSPVLHRGLPLDSVLSAPPPRPLPRPDHLYDFGGDPNDLKRQRWAVIAPRRPRGPELVECVKPLIRRRAEQQEAEVCIYYVPPNMDAVQAEAWRKQVLRASSVRTREQPRYLLVLGQPHEVSLEFQQHLAVDSFVGRLAFDRPEDYRAYVDKVLRWEEEGTRERARSLFFTAHDGSPALEDAYQHLVTPNLRLAREDHEAGRFAVQRVIEVGSPQDYAAREAADLLLEAAREAPASTLFTASHGVGVPGSGRRWGSPQEQRSRQGALGLGKDAQGQRYRLHADALKGRPFLPGGIWFLFACFGIGTPARSTYLPWLEELKARNPGHANAISDILASRPLDGQGFLAALPTAALANPEGPLAVMGHLDLAWTHAFRESARVSRAERFYEVLQQLVSTSRAGVALGSLTKDSAQASVELTDLYQGEASALHEGTSPTREGLNRALLWMLRNDLAGYVLLGDPAVRLPRPRAQADLRPPLPRPDRPLAPAPVIHPPILGSDREEGPPPTPHHYSEDRPPPPRNEVIPPADAPRQRVPHGRAPRYGALSLELHRKEELEKEFLSPTGPLTYFWNQGNPPAQSTFDWRQRLDDLRNLVELRPDRSAVQRLGDALREFVMPFDWRSTQEAIRQAEKEGRELGLTLRFKAAELYSLPWELLTLQGSGKHLGQVPGLDLRYTFPGAEVDTPSEPPPAGGRLLFAWSSAGGPVPWRNHLEALREACQRGNYPFDPDKDVLAYASLAGLKRALEPGPDKPPVAVLHLLCHGASHRGAAGLMLDASAPGTPPMPVDGATLHEALGEHARGLRLVVLAACRGGDSQEFANHLGSVAQMLHRRGIPAVVASRLPLSVERSEVLTRTLYRELLEELSSLPQALAAAREAMRQGSDTLDWASLQLYAFEHEGPDYHPFVFRPYRGLRAFEPKHSRFFMGRGKLREELKQRILEASQDRRPRFQVVAGASGSGKSSLVMAGVAPSLPAQSWDYRIIRPGDVAELEELERHGHAPGGRHTLLIVDQFEEVFTHLQSQQERDAHVHRLWALAREGSKVVVVATLRVDFLGRCGEVSLEGGRKLDSIVYDEAHRLFVPQIGSEEYREVITAPAHRVGLRFDEGLVEQLVKDLGEEPGALPLLQYALDVLWQRRQGGCLTREAYKQLTGGSGISGALTDTLDKLYQELSNAEQAHARRIFVNLVEFHDDSSPYTRRRLELKKLPVAEADRKCFDGVLEKLIQSRFIVRSSSGTGAEAAEYIEVAHEALIRKWAQLTQWIQEDREKELQLRELQRSAETWLQHQASPDRGASFLLRGNRLGHAQELRKRYGDALTEEANRFITESQRAEDHKRRVRRGWILTGVSLSTVAAVVMTLLWLRADEDRKRTQGIASTAMADSLLDSDPTLAAPLLTEEKLAYLDYGWAFVAFETLAQPLATTILKIPSLNLTSCAFAPDATHVLIAAADGAIYRWPIHDQDWPSTIKPASNPPIDGNHVALSPNGARALWLLTDQDVVHAWHTDGKYFPINLKIDSGAISKATFSHDSTRVLIVSSAGTALIRSADGQGPSMVVAENLDIYSLHTAAFSGDGNHVIIGTSKNIIIQSTDNKGSPIILEQQGTKAATISHDGTRALLIDENHSTVWNIKDKAKLIQIPHMHDRPGQGTFSPNGKSVLFTHGDGTTSLWTIDTNKTRKMPSGHTAGIQHATFSPNGDSVLTASWDGTARLWYPDDENKVFVLKGHGRSIMCGVFSQDGSRIVTVSYDGTARIWNPPFRRSEAIALKAGSPVMTAAFSPDGTRVLTVHREEESPRLWNLEEPSNPRVLNPPHGYTVSGTSAAFGRNGALLLLDNEEGNATRLWHVEEPSLTRDFPGKAVALSSDGNQVLILSEQGPGDAIAQIWRTDVPSKPVTLKGYSDMDGEVAPVFSPDGSRILLVGAPDANGEHLLNIWSTDKEGDPLTIQISQVSAMAWTPDGTEVFTGHKGGTVRRWDAQRLEEQEAARGQYSMVTVIAFSHDGKQILIGDSNGRIHLRRIDERGAPLLLKGNSHVLQASFSPDGSRVLSGQGDGITFVWTLDKEKLKSALRKATSVCLNTSQRKQYLNETLEEARRACEACERSHNRPPRNCTL